MIRRSCWAVLLLSLCLQLRAAAMQSPAAPATKPGVGGEKKDPLAGFRWLDTSGDTRGVLFEGRQLSSLSPNIRNQSLQDVEIEVSRPGADSVRTTRRVYDRNTNGERVLVEVVVEDVRSTGADAFSATRTQSQRDVNGNMQVAMRQVQESAPAGPGSYRTRITTMGPGVKGALSPSEETVQVENKKAGGTVEIERTQRVANADGSWIPAERRVSSTGGETGRSLTEENIYRQDANGKLVLSRTEVSREWTDPQGKVVQEREVSLPNASGKFELNERLTITRQTYSDGSQQTSQNRLRKSAAASSEGLKVTETIVQTDTPSGSHATERVTMVQTPDVNGKLQTTTYGKAVIQK